eukprot:comp21058_c0_seq1/m.28328 comp21058_c0_seq1/g.28328  ORF comp21058_c0_seq1/g.28328 comp21058_c0_seq1/m.28328 type:complete len:217 (-) comp21058_c0_seq1:446-1096(-)
MAPNVDTTPQKAQRMIETVQPSNQKTSKPRLATVNSAPVFPIEPLTVPVTTPQEKRRAKTPLKARPTTSNEPQTPKSGKSKNNKRNSELKSTPTTPVPVPPSHYNYYIPHAASFTYGSSAPTANFFPQPMFYSGDVTPRQRTISCNSEQDSGEDSDSFYAAGVYTLAPEPFVLPPPPMSWLKDTCDKDQLSRDLKAMLNLSSAGDSRAVTGHGRHD